MTDTLKALGLLAAGYVAMSAALLAATAAALGGLYLFALAWVAVFGAATPPEVPLAGPVRVIDGDTLVAAGERIRLRDIDAPELKGARCANERDLAESAAALLEQLLERGPVTVIRYGKDQYGRTLAYVMVDGRPVQERLVGWQLAEWWDGRGPRPRWC
jgi:endonuclease YncB( thermonuclease family)